MKFNDFIMDRLLYIVIFLVNVVLILLVISLDLLQSAILIEKGNIIYIFVLSLVGLSLFLMIDYASKKAYFNQLTRLNQEGEDVEASVVLSGAANREQQQVQDLMHARHRLYSDQLTQHRQRQEHHHHFMNQWVHHMKTPVSVIGLLTQQSRDIVTTGQAKKLLQSIEEENEKLAYGLEMVLQMARLDQFELDVHVKRVDLNGLIRSVINDNKKSCIRQAIYPKLVSSEPQIIVETDEKWMRFVFNQLMGNAIKYSKLGNAAEDMESKQLLFNVERTPQGISVHVEDEGIGIQPQDIPRVFDAFFTGENGRLTAASTGMGLFLAKQVCGRLGHRLTVRSDYGKGSIFTVSYTSESLHRDVWQ
ncbi:sensor histidine kinase [Paenibacillus foliorum]|nr:sensor histidine kinase [Paenibacillus foliorum]